MFSNNSRSQYFNNDIEKILEKIEEIDKNRKIKNYYHSIELDGIINSKKRKFLIGKRKIKGGFSTAFLIKDNNLEFVNGVTRTFEPTKEIYRENKIKTYIYEKNKLVYYLEINETWADEENHSIISKIEFFVNNNEIIKQNLEGNISFEINKYFNEVLKESEKLVIEKDELLLNL